MERSLADKAVSVKQIQRLDKAAIEQYGVSSIALMENAGAAVAREIVRQLKRVSNPRVCIICGLGNNAGDGFVAARHLINAGVRTKIFLIGKGEDLKHDAMVNYQILKNIKYPIVETHSISSLDDIACADVVVDAIFGVGLSREIKDPFYSVIELINKNAKKVISVDIPSGLDGTSGNVYGICVKAHTTVSFSLTKKGFFKKQGLSHVGKVVVVDIGIPVKLMNKARS